MSSSSPLPFASLSGVTIDKLHLVVPASGIWHADVSLTTDFDVPGPQVLTLSGSTWNCAIVRAVDFAGYRELRLVGGTGGWRKTVPAQEYGPSAVGVPTATVLSDVALAVQEAPPVLDPTAAPTLGSYWIRQRGAASLALWDMVTATVLSTWWVDVAGIVQTASRLSTPILSPFVVEQVRGASGWYRVATESPGDWQPGRTFASPTVSGTISRVEHRLSRGKFWTEALVP